MIMEEAVRLLAEDGNTCVIFCGDDVRTSKARGVKPLLDWLDSGEDFSSFSSADKVIGNGAAFLYYLLGIKTVHTHVISEPALETMKRGGIDISYDELVPAIKDRSGKGFCPIEACVKGITDPQEALQAIRIRLSQF